MGNLIQAVLLAAVNSGNRKTWHILLPTFQFGSNNKDLYSVVKERLQQHFG